MITKEQALDPSSREFWHMKMKNADGTPLRVRRTGQTQTWVTRPNEWRIPVKYVLRDGAYITQQSAHLWCLPKNWPIESELFRGVTA